MSFLYVISLIMITYFTGRWAEKKHQQNLLTREKSLAHLITSNDHCPESDGEDLDCRMFDGGVVVAADFFKIFIAGLKSLLGGRLTTYESLLERGRREALLRMQEKAHLWGAEKLVNVRLETAIIGGPTGTRALPCVEIYAYGTALRKKQSRQ